MRADPCPATTPQVLARAAITAPGQEAIVCGPLRVDYRELSENVEQITGALLGLGLRKGDRVALCDANGPRWVELFYAITACGGVVVPVNTRYRGEELRRLLTESRSRFLFTASTVLSSNFVEMLRAVCPAVETSLPDAAMPELEAIVLTDECAQPPPGMRAWAAFASLSGDRSMLPEVRPDDLALIQYTSGTTARPKGVLLTHRSMCLDAFFSGTRMGLRIGSRFHSVRPFFHVAGSVLSVLASAQCLSTLVTMVRFEAGPALAVLEGERCTHFSANDTIALMLLAHPDLAHRRLSLVGGWLAAAPVVVHRVMDELGAGEVVVGYGLSEASPNVAQSAWYEPAEVRGSAAMLPQPGVTVRIWDLELDRSSRTGTPGEIQVRGWNVMQGYFEMPDETAAAFTADGWLRTGDLGYVDDSGRLTFVGRAKELIRVGGENVSPAEIEDLLHQHPAVKQAVVVGVPDRRLIEVPFAFVLLRESAACSSADLLAWITPRLAGFKVPRHLEIVDSFESIGMTASSKVQKGRLAEHARALLECP